MKTFDIRFRKFKRGRRSESVVQVKADTPAGARRKLINNIPVDKRHHIEILSVWAAER